MSEIKFSCPNCQQHIAADQGYAGLQIACPACHSSFVVPGTPAPAAPAIAPPPAGYAAPPASVAAPAPPAAAAATGCPSCGSALPRGAVLCTRCGYNLATKTRMVAGKVAPMGSAMAPSSEVPWYKTAYPYIGVVLLLLIGLYLGGRSNPAMMIAFVLVLVLYCLVVHLLAVISAFRESVGTGFLTLCIPFYAVYYVFKVSENSTLQILYSFAVLINIILRFIPLKDLG